MALWGIAYAAGPNYNKAWRYFAPEDLRSSVKRANDALARAAKLSDQASPVERALIEAITARFPPTDKIPDDLSYLDRAYADAMRPVYEKFGDDPDVAALFADALMCITPRGLWDLDTGKPTGDHTVEARRAIELALKRPDGYNHPALCHLHIHMLEMSPFPELALPAADRLRGLVPDGSHMLHMPTHIDVAVGDYRRSVDSNHEAIVADDKYFAREDASIQYTAYRVHYICAKLYAAMMSGRFTDAMSAAEKLEQVIDAKLLSPSRPWRTSDRSVHCVTTASILYARGLALSALGHIPEAEAVQKEFEAARAAVPTSRLNSIPCKEVDVLGVASAMLAGELEYRKGNYDTAFSTLRRAIELEDALPYSDPPPWMQPVRHALGGLLLEQNRVGEAEVVFREDLGMARDFPRRRAKLNNVWGLHGLYECFTRSGKIEEALFIQASRDIALASADVPVTTSCYCRRSAVEETRCCS
ncbi:hypothetical protein IFM47457_05960 [Aspergillus lentulus]|nr:hypothetical protein IFM47457_05960 [Aspergillus lentulus]